MLQGPQAASCDGNDALLLLVVSGEIQEKLSYTVLGTTHIIIGATVAKNGDASAAKLEDEKGYGVELRLSATGSEA